MRVSVGAKSRVGVRVLPPPNHNRDKLERLDLPIPPLTLRMPLWRESRATAPARPNRSQENAVVRRRSAGCKGATRLTDAPGIRMTFS